MSKKNNDRRGDSIRWFRHSIVPEGMIPRPQRPAPKKAIEATSRSGQNKSKKK